MIWINNFEIDHFTFVAKSKNVDFIYALILHVAMTLRNWIRLKCYLLDVIWCFHCRNPSLGLATKAKGLATMRTKRKARECGRVWGWTLTLPSELPSWEFESLWTFESLENDCEAQNPFPWGGLSIIEKLSKRRCRKWACMTHLDIWNKSYG